MSIESQHQEMVKALVKPGADILRSLTPAKVDLWHAATGIVTEAGEFMNAVKTHVIYGKPLDSANVREEFGDMEFYLEQARTNLLVMMSRIDTLWGNFDKLKERYKGLKYSDTAAIAREDKAVVGETRTETVG